MDTTTREGSPKWRLAQALEIRWWQHYLKEKSPAEYARWKCAYWHTFLEKIMIDPGPGEKVLDAGCGPSGIFTVLSQQSVDAVDPLLLSYQKRLSHFQPADYPWVRFFAQTLETFEPGPAAYDLVFCLNALNHVYDPQTALGKLAAGLKPGGRLVLSVDAHRFQLLQAIFSWAPGDLLHPQQFGRKDYENMLAAHFVLDGVAPQRLNRGLVFDYVVWVLEKRAL